MTNTRLELPGIFYDEPNDVYHARKDYDSFSNIKTLIRSPELYKKGVDGLLPDEQKEAWEIGNAVHTAILEPEKLSQYYFADESYNGTTREGKAIKADCDAKGIKLLNAANSFTYHHCVSALHESDAVNLFQQGDPEVTWRVSSATLKLQCRTDWMCHNAPAGLEQFGINEGERYVADLKTTQSIDDWLNDSQWKNPLTNDLFYAGQEAFYRPVIDNVLLAGGHGRVDKWVFVVVEKKEPFRVAVIRTPHNVQEWAKGKVECALLDLIQRKKADQWTDERLQGVYEPFVFVK